MSRKSSMFLSAFLGGAALYLWQKARRPGVTHPVRDITRWEDEGGAVPPPAPKAWVSAASAPATKPNADAEVGSTPDAWKFPKS